MKSRFIQPVTSEPYRQPEYGPTAPQRVISGAVEKWRARPARRPEQAMPVQPQYAPQPQYVERQPEYVPAPPQYAPPAPIVTTSQLRLIGEPADVDRQVNAMRNAGFTLASIHVRKTRDVNDTNVILTATLISQ